MVLIVLYMAKYTKLKCDNSKENNIKITAKLPNISNIAVILL